MNWRGEIDLSAADFFTDSRPERRAYVLQEATRFLQELLANGSVSVEEAEAAAGEESISLRT